MKAHKTPPRATGRTRDGFALVVTLTLMVLLSILALGMLSLSSVTLRTGSRDEAMTQARANARMALQLAIGQLQAELGPDQRISAPATLLEDPAVPHDSKKYWTATYESWSDTATSRPSPVFRKWLVSQDPATSPSRSFAEAEPASDSVPVYAHGTEQVLVPKIAAPGGTGTGALAWWTSDDNQKAALLPPPEDTDPGADLRALAMSGGNGGFPLIETVGTKPFENVDPAAFREGSAATFGQTSLLVGADPATSPGAFPHLTTNAGGLITDVREGGFRKDLSVLFAQPFDQMPSTPLYTADGVEGGALDEAAIASSPTGEGGVSWKELWAFHNLPQRLTQGYSKDFTTGGPPSTGQDIIVTKTGKANIMADPWLRYPHPSHIRYQAIVSLWAEKDEADPAKRYQIYFVVDPIVTVWNPFDVAISFAGAYNSVKYWHIPYTIDITEVGGTTFSAPLAESVGNSAGNANYITMRVGHPKEIILRPGEVAVFSQSASGPILKHDGKDRKINAAPGWNYGSGAAYRVRRKNSGGTFEDYKVSGEKYIRFGVKPNNKRAVSGSPTGTVSYGLTMNDFWIYEENPTGSAPSQESIFAGGVRIDSGQTAPTEGLKAVDFPEVFTSIPDDGTEFPVKELVVKQPMLIYSYILKNESSEIPSNRPSRYLSRLNPKVFSYNFEKLSGNEFETVPWEIQIRPLNAFFDSIVDTSGSGAGYFGPGVLAVDGANQVITHSVPREHPVSLAAFQHSIANGIDHGGLGTGNPKSYILLPGVGHIIGNSLALPVIPMDKTEGKVLDRNLVSDADSEPLADHSYLANTALWDEWFLSGISPQTYSTFDSKRAQRQVGLEFFNQTQSLPTSRYDADTGGREPGALVDEILSATPTDDAKLALSAAHIRVDGMFNVNSTSTEAWKAVLASLRDLPTPAQDLDGKDTEMSEENETPVSNLLTPRALKVPEENLNQPFEPNQWIGRRMLTDDEISALAEAIVRQVKDRGPFLSTADFVNRRVGTDAGLAASGAIQAALDDPLAKVNARLIESRGINPTTARPGLLFPDPEKGAPSYGSAGYVKQADLLTPMAPWISVRSDSFTIRAYGESKSSTGEIVRAWCEATVERDAEYVDPSDPRTTLPGALKPANKTFGRRFLVTSFRWMNPSEIR